MVATSYLEEIIKETYKEIKEYLNEEGIKVDPKANLEIIKKEINPTNLDNLISSFIIKLGEFLTLPKELKAYAHIKSNIYSSLKSYNAPPPALYVPSINTIYVYLPKVLENLPCLIDAKNNLEKESLDDTVKKICFHNRTSKTSKTLSPFYDVSAEILITPTTKNLSSDEDIIKKYFIRIMSHEIIHTLNRSLNLPKYINEYIASVLETLLYFKLNLRDNNKLDKKIYEILYTYNPHYKTLNSTKLSYKNTEDIKSQKELIETLEGLMRKDPYSLGRYTGYYILEKYGPENIRIKDIYEKLIIDRYHFLKEYFKQ